MFKKDEIITALMLLDIPGIGPAKIKSVYDQGLLSEIIGLSLNELNKLGLFKEDQASSFVDSMDKIQYYEQEISTCKSEGIEVITYSSRLYPSQLFEISNPPPVIFLKGRSSLLNSKKKVGIAGSRNANTVAKEWCLSVSKELSDLGYTIISGGALGIDTKAHEGALMTENGDTISVVGGGLNRLYPPENKDLFKQIIGRGLLLSEQLLDKPPSRFGLLARNRIISGLSDFCIIVASDIKGGAMSFSKNALSQDKKIFVPKDNGNILPHNGIKKIVKEKKAIDIEKLSDIFEKQLQTKLSNN